MIALALIAGGLLAGGAYFAVVHFTRARIDGTRKPTTPLLGVVQPPAKEDPNDS